MLSNLVVFDITTTQLAASLGVLVAYGIYKIATFIYYEATCPLCDVPGPPNPSLLYGNVKELSESNNFVPQEGWLNQYGPTVRIKAMLGSCQLITTDPKTITHILYNNYEYEKPKYISGWLRERLGNGLLAAEGDVHKYQRKVLNPAFGPQQIRELTETFVEKALELRDIWSTEIAKHDSGVGPIECLSWMSRTTLDIIGLAGFNYKFNALTQDPHENELMKSFSILLESEAETSVISIIKALCPPIRFLPASNNAERKKASTVMGRIGSDLLKQSKAALEDHKRSNSASGRKDLLSLLVQANTNEDLPAMRRMTDEDVLSQIPTFLIAGHQTTSVAMTWALYALTQKKEAQTKLRQEVSNVPTDNPTMDDLNGLPYLDAVVRETLRLHAPLSGTLRAASKDDCIPVTKPFIDKKGIVRNEIRVRKGQVIVIPISLVNRDKMIWGEDAKEFKPERWANIPDAATSVPGVWANLMTFFGGPRACIGYRFAFLEMKALLFTLVRAFELDLAIPAKDIGTKSIDIMRPILLTDPNNSNQMPLLVRPISN